MNAPIQRHPLLFRATVALVAVVALLDPNTARAQGERVGAIVVAHGGDSLWNAQVIDAARAARTGGPVEVSFLMGPAAKTTRFQDAVAKLEKAGASEVVVVPMLVSSHSGHFDQIRYLVGTLDTLDETMMHHLHMSGIERAKTKLAIRMASALDDAPEMARVLSDRALALTSEPASRALFIVGHGPNSAEDYAQWMKYLRRVADSVKVMTGFKDVRVDLVRDDAPADVRAEAVLRVRELIELQQKATGKEVIVVPVLVSTGSVSRDKVPNDIKGTPAKYAGAPLLPHPAMSRWIERQVRTKSAAATQ
jgi:sirohydrochlorin cobaltochelatase